MYLNSLITFLFILTNCLSNSITFYSQFDCFRAAVYEHILIENETDSAFHLIKSNLDIFDEVASKASKLGADILLFPEYGIIDPNSRKQSSEFAEEIDDPLNGKTYNPCENPNNYKNRTISYRLSCMAKKNHMYIVADMSDIVKCNITIDNNCPKDGYYLFNTAVAYDTEGYLVAKYHKMHLFLEPIYNSPSKAELIYFDTPFGRMGLNICFDIAFKLPGTKLVSDFNVTTMLMPTWWYDMLPFAFATQTQQAWAITNKVNLLAANIHSPKEGSLGSGIYSGERGAIIYTDVPDGKSKLLIADIPIDSKNTNAKCLSNTFNETIPITTTQVVVTQYNHMIKNMNDFSRVKLTKQNDSMNICNNGLCCRLDYSVESKLTLEEESYYFVIANRTDYTLVIKPNSFCEEICGIVRCDSNCSSIPIKTEKTIFKNIQISTKFSTKYSYPSVSTNNLQLVPKNKWIYKNNGVIGSEVTLELNDFHKPIMTAGFYGRCYERDL